MRLLICLTLFLLALASIAADFHQNVSVEVVNVFLSATDSKHRFVSDLRPEDLILAEDGRPQKILGISNLAKEPADNREKAQPLSVAFCMDTSGSMSELTGSTRKLEVTKKAALAVLSELSSEDQMTVVGFNYLPHVLIPLTPQKSFISGRISFLHPENAPTALFDSLYMMVEEARKYPGRKFLVLGTDGLDTASHVTLDSLLEQLKTSDITVLIFAFPSVDQTAPDGHYALEKIAEITGGYAFFLKDADDLSLVLNQIRSALRSQYTVWYSPQPDTKAESWRTIQISCKRPGVDLRYRTRYFSGPIQPQQQSASAGY